jgi:plastocyanin
MRLGGLITAVAFCVIATPAQGETTHQVNVGGDAFSPAELTITQGDAVTWNWVGPDTNHSTTTTDEGQTTWDSAPGNPSPNEEIGRKFSWTYPFVGEYSYFCKVHSFMQGKIVVVRKVNDPNGPPADTAAPKIGTPTAQVKRRRVMFTLDEDATVTAILRGPRRKTVKKEYPGGQNVLRLPKRLKAGRYTLTLRATDAAGNKSLAARVKFRVKKSR